MYTHCLDTVGFHFLTVIKTKITMRMARRRRTATPIVPPIIPTSVAPWLILASDYVVSALGVVVSKV